jgi:flavin reductase (DIM6/NTAB) family NADH-FMN oxidoreductase RutF
MTTATAPVEFIPGPDTQRQFRDALGGFATGVTLVTTQGPEGPLGFAANSFAAVSLEPPLVLWSPGRASRRFPHFVAATYFAIHVLPVAARDWLARFARDGVGFDGLPHGRNAEGVPVLDAALARFDCRKVAQHEGGDHVILVGEVLRAACRRDEALVFCQGRYGRFSPLD